MTIFTETLKFSFSVYYYNTALMCSAECQNLKNRQSIYELSRCNVVVGEKKADFLIVKNRVKGERAENSGRRV